MKECHQMTRRILALAITAAMIVGIFSTIFSRPATETSRLKGISETLKVRWETQRTTVYHKLLSNPSPAQAALNRSPEIELVYINERGMPRHFVTHNVNAARTISTNRVHPGGSGGFDLDGSTTLPGQLAVWDGGGVLYTHQEFEGRVTQEDSPSSIHYHSTHVAGTMIGAGIVSNAKGMSFAAPLSAYDWDFDESEMAAAAADGLNVSNHSYGFATGWRYDGGEQAWYWWGDVTVSTTEDYGFGFYGTAAQSYDNIAFQAPYYTIVKSAGNDRNDFGPVPGGEHFYWDSDIEDWALSTAVRDADGGPDGYDCVAWYGVAKNIITVGAVNDLTAGWTNPAGVSMSTFSSWGPTDDGRIKPDIVGNGVSLYSTDSDNAVDYTTLSGTSMSSPNVSGSVNLLYRYYEQSHGGTTPLASTVKALVIHGADEAGPNPGPDYMFGWGLMNTLTSMQMIQDDSAGASRIIEDDLADGSEHTWMTYSDGTTPLRMTIVWTDPPGTPAAAAANPTDLMLVNDLDIRIEHLTSSIIYEPYMLDPANPSNAASTGDNFRDNVEQIHLEAPDEGIYSVSITHKGTLANGHQVYSLVSSTPEWTPCCGLYDPDGLTGNVDHDPGNFKDISDILMIARYSLQGGDIPECLAEANTDGDSECFTDISDILRLARYALQGGEAPAHCLLECE
jgi:hypothetical protein